MALQKQIIPISFGEGIETKTDVKQQIVGKLRRAVNVVFETVLSAKKRNGYDSILLYDTSNVRVDTAQALSKYKNELLIFDPNYLYSFSDSLQKLQQKGNVYSVFPFSTPVLNNSYNHDSLDVISVENLNVYVYHNTITDDVRYSVQDSVSKSLLVSDDVVDTGSQRVQVAAVGNYIYIIYAKGANLKYRRFNILTPASIESSVLLAADVDVTAPLIDAVSGPDKIIVAYNSTQAGSELHVFDIDSSGVAGSIAGVSGAHPSTALDVQLGTSYRAIIGYSNGSAIGYCIFPYNLVAVVLPATNIETIANVKNISSISTSPGTYKFYYEVSAANSVDYYIKSADATLAGSVSNIAVFKRSVGLASKVFLHDSTVYIPVALQTTLQSTYFLCAENGTVVSKWAPGTGGGHVTTGILPQSIAREDGTFLLTNSVKGKSVSENGTFFSLLGIQGTTIDFNYPVPNQTAFLADNLHISGGLLQMYDGDSVVEHGFNMYPENLTAGTLTSGVGNLAAGNYAYKAVYRWTDNAGQEHRSAPSLALSVVIASGSSHTQEVIVPTLRLTEKQNVVIELYRTESNGTIYYMVSSTSAPTFNNTAVDTVTISDAISDADLISRQTLYTTGGVLDNTAAPAATSLAVHTASNRLIIANEAAPVVQYSKIRQEGVPVEFNDDLAKTLDPTPGKIKALAAMDDKIIIFQENGIQYFSGAGPLNTGEQDTFTDPELLSSDVGCSEPKSVLFTTMGIFFKSQKGIYLLTRDLSLRYIGAPVEAYNGLTISSAKVIADFNQIRFTTSDGDCIVYNYHLDLWCTFDNHRALSAELVGDQYYYLRSNRELFKENKTSFADNGSPIKLQLETGWMSMSALQGFQRAYQLMILGDYKSAHKLRVKAAFNFNEAYTQEKVIVPSANFIDATPYGGYSPYGFPESVAYGNNKSVYQARFDFKQQKCQAIRLLIEDEQSVAGEGLSLSAMTILAGGKGGLFKIDNSGKFGLE